MKLRTLAAAIVATLLCGTAFAHHSFSAEFDAAKPVKLTGIVTKVEWTNPHVWFYINVKDEATGAVTNWGAEMGPPHGLQRSGWRRETLKIGESVSVDEAREAARLCALNALAAVAVQSGGLAGISSIVKVTGFVASAPGFNLQPDVLNGASELLGEVFGDAGLHARSAVGVAELPMDAPVEVELVVMTKADARGE